MIELLEKRVKSRFSHRQIHFLHDFGFDEYMKMASNALQLESKHGDPAVDAWNTQVREALADKNLVTALQIQFDLDKDPRALSTILVSSLVEKQWCSETKTDLHRFFFFFFFFFFF